MEKHTLHPPANTNIIPSQVPAETFKPAVNNQNPVAVSTNITLKKNKKYYIRIRATIRKGQRKASGPWVKIVKKTKA
mgnify:CR=1 FL=1